MEQKKVKSPSGATSSKIARLELVWREAVVRIAKRCEAGIASHGDGAVNAMSPNKAAYHDKEFILQRLAHTIDHAFKMIEIVSGNALGDGDDHAAAIAWAGGFLCEVTKNGVILFEEPEKKTHA
jgi:hypothetical protein